MKAASLNGTIGLILCLALGMRVLHLAPSEILLAVLVSNLGGLCAALLTLQAESIPALKRPWLSGSIRTWTLLLGIYFGILLGLCPTLREPTHFIYLILPLLMSTGFAIIIFGPIQDRIVRRRQRKISAPSH